MTATEQDMAPATNTMVQPVLSVTETAATRLLGMMRERDLSEDYALRVFVSGGGCSGLQYGMTFDNEMVEGDTEFAAHSLRVLVDPMSARYLQGANVDFITDDLMGSGFKIDNPNAVSGCGCGHSFRTEEGGEANDEAASGCGSCSGH